MGYKAKIVSPIFASEIQSKVLEEVPRDGIMRSVIISGHSTEDIFRYSYNEFFDARSLSYLIESIFEYRLPHKNLSIYLSGGFTACKSQTKTSLNESLMGKLWTYNNVELNDLIQSLTVIGHLDTSERGRKGQKS
ncbi:MAG: hypothetical protein H6625_03225 [Bdellovibrionaceae bacterium]|nr:hypothetical protein [Pseudobdellovibrionaceae bacterium]